jgi:hypothetical protein
MSIRNSTSFLGLCLATAAAGLFSSVSAQQWTTPRTAWGHPDLQGNWSNATVTPLERAVGHRPIYRQAQLDSVEGDQRARVEAGIAPTASDRAPLKVTGSTGGYNEIYFDRGDRAARVNGEPRSSLITFPSNGRLPALSAVGQRRMTAFEEFRAQFSESDHPELRTQSDQCLASFGSNMGPPMLPNYNYNNNYTIVQNEDHVLISTEMVHDIRVIRLREPTPIPDDFRPWWGISWGHWEGSTLVAETSNIYQGQIFRIRGGGQRLYSEKARVIERFTRVDDGTILYEFEVDDPDMYSGRWGGQVPMRRFDDLLYEYACHEGNHAMEGILSGARYQESLVTPGGQDSND